PDADFTDDGWTLKSAMRYHAFWALFSTFFFTAVAMYAITAQVVAYLIDAGFPPLQAATAWGFSGLVVLFGMLGISTLDGIIGLGSGLGCWAGGLIHDWTHSYNLLFAFALVNVVLGLIPFLVVPALRR